MPCMYSSICYAKGLENTSHSANQEQPLYIDQFLATLHRFCDVLRISFSSCRMLLKAPVDKYPQDSNTLAA